MPLRSDEIMEVTEIVRKIVKEEMEKLSAGKKSVPAPGIPKVETPKPVVEESKAETPSKKGWK